MAFRRGLTCNEISVLLEDIPSDYEQLTDEESDDDFSSKDTIALDTDTIIELRDDTTVIIVGDTVEQATSDQDFQATSARYESENVPEELGEDASQGEKRKWRKKDEKIANIEFVPSAQHVHDISTPLDAFFLFFDSKLFDMIHYESNLLSVQKGKPASISTDELKVFLGINMVMGYNSRPSLADHWSSQKDLENLVIKAAMSRNRFQTLLSNIHLNDNSKINASNRDKLYKVRPLLDHLNCKFQQNRQPGEFLCIDESMILFKGRSSLKQYNPMKPIKRGYKLWCLSDDQGYVFKTKVYTGKDKSPSNNEHDKTIGLGGKVVMLMLNDLQKSNHKITFDNFFSSIPLMELLQTKRLLACATIRSNRKGFPPLVKDKEMKRGDCDYRATPGGITVYKWMDSKPVHFISNYHGMTPSTVQRKMNDGTKVTVTCPSVVSDYNRHMGGVDKHDMLRKLYGANRKSKKWWHRIFFGLVDMTIINAFVLYKEHCEAEISLFEFYREIALGLLTYAHRSGPGPSKRRRGLYSTPASVRLSNVIHLPDFTKNKNRCEVCSVNGIQARPLSKCSHCGVHLCCNATKNCFKVYHTE